MDFNEDVSRAMTSLQREKESGKIVSTFSFHRDLPLFRGHFPGMPLLPGVMQIEMARATVSGALERPFSVAAIRKAKFSTPILPDTEVRLEVETEEADGRVNVKGRLLAPDGEAGRIAMTLIPAPRKTKGATP